MCVRTRRVDAPQKDAVADGLKEVARLGRHWQVLVLGEELILAQAVVYVLRKRNLLLAQKRVRADCPRRFDNRLTGSFSSCER